jgi:hypothetical protein
VPQSWMAGSPACHDENSGCQPPLLVMAGLDPAIQEHGDATMVRHHEDASRARRLTR